MIAEQIQDFLKGLFRLIFRADVLIVAGMALATYATYDHWGRWPACMVAGCLLVVIGVLLGGGKK
jgi:hypothetical protein